MAAKEGKFRGHWSSYTYGSAIHGQAKIKFIEKDIIDLTLIYAPNSVFRANQHIKFRFNITRNEQELYGSLNHASAQQVFIKIQLKEPVFRGEYLSLNPYDYGSINMSDASLCDYILKHVPDTGAIEPEVFERDQMCRNSKSCCILL